MKSSTSQANELALSELLVSAGIAPLTSAVAAKFDAYLSLLVRWNARTNLTGIRDPQDILRRHFVESIACAQNVPQGVRSLLDFGSGAGFPGIPIALCRSEIAVTLAESQNKKASFLREAVRSLGLNSTVFAHRGETMTEMFDCVTLRAVDQMSRAAVSASTLVRELGWLALLTTKTNLPLLENELGPVFSFDSPIPLPGSEQRILALAAKRTAAADMFHVEH